MKTISLVLILIGLNFAGLASNFNEKKKSNFLLKDETGVKCFNENTHIINIGVGVASGRYYRGVGGDYSGSPAFSISYEQPWKSRVGPGFLGVGAYLGMQTARYRYNYHGYYYGNGGDNYYYEHKWTYSMIAARAAYHWDVLNKEKYELYGGAVIGLRIQSYRYTDNDPYYSNENTSGAVYPAFSLFAGARFYFTKNIGVFAELGYGISYATGGLSFKF